MAVRMSANFPNMDKGTELDVGGVLVENGGSVELDDEQELAFVSRHRKSVKDWAGDGEYVKVTGSPKYGPKAVEDMFPQPSAEQPVSPENLAAPAEPVEEGSGS
jgi:hypothetical protein